MINKFPILIERNVLIVLITVWHIKENKIRLYALSVRNCIFIWKIRTYVFLRLSIVCCIISLIMSVIYASLGSISIRVIVWGYVGIPLRSVRSMLRKRMGLWILISARFVILLFICGRINALIMLRGVKNLMLRKNVLSVGRDSIWRVILVSGFWNLVRPLLILQMGMEVIVLLGVC